MGLMKRGHRTIIACAESGHVRRNAADNGLTTDNIKVLNACDLISIAKITRIIAKEKIDIILANLGKEYWPAAAAAKLMRKKIILVRHQRDRIRRTTRCLMNLHVDRVIAVSGAVKESLSASGISEEKIAIVYNAISLDRFEPSWIDRSSVRAELGIAEDDIVVGTVGKLHSGKGVYTLLDAAGRIYHDFPSLRLLFVGDGPEKEGIIRQAGLLGIADRIVMTGVRQDVERMYSAMNIFALPSHNEGMPTVLIEAMAMNIPVIATPVGGVHEIISGGENGLLVPPGDETMLAGSIVRLLTEREFASRIAAKGRQTVKSAFSDGTLAERFEEIFLTLGIR